jgi:hypothetical protein
MLKNSGGGGASSGTCIWTPLDLPDGMHNIIIVTPSALLVYFVRKELQILILAATMWNIIIVSFLVVSIMKA